MSSITSRLVLRQLGEGEYRDLGIPAVLARGISLRPGQGLNDSSQIVQIASVTRDDDVDTRDAFRSFGSAIRWEVHGLRCEPLPMTVRRRTPATKRVTIGIADLSLEPVEVDLSLSHFAISGPPRSGRSTALRSIARQLEESGEAFAVVGPRYSPLSSVTLWMLGPYTGTSSVKNPGCVAPSPCWPGMGSRL